MRFETTLDAINRLLSLARIRMKVKLLPKTPYFAPEPLKTPRFEE
jgi:hypothetical protein